MASYSFTSANDMLKTGRLGTVAQQSTGLAHFHSSRGEPAHERHPLIALSGRLWEGHARYGGKAEETAARVRTGILVFLIAGANR